MLERGLHIGTITIKDEDQTVYMFGGESDPERVNDKHYRACAQLQTTWHVRQSSFWVRVLLQGDIVSERLAVSYRHSISCHLCF